MSSKRRASALGVVFAAVVLAACQGREAAVAPSEMTLTANNATTKSISLIVNGSAVREVQPWTQVVLTSSDLPVLPWMATVRLQSGRTLLSLTVHAGDVVIGPTSAKGVGVRVDLSCGRIDLWSGPPVSKPAPRPGTPGDCDP